MNHNGGFGHDDWGKGPFGSHHGHDTQGNHPAPLSTTLSSLALQAGLWASGCLVLASTAPAVLVASLLHDLLVLSAFLVSMVALLRGETLSFTTFNQQDVAFALLALGMLAGLFIDHAAVHAFIQAHAALHGAAASHAAASHAAASHAAASHAAAGAASTSAG